MGDKEAYALAKEFSNKFESMKGIISHKILMPIFIRKGLMLFIMSHIMLKIL